MPETGSSRQSSLLESLEKVIRDGIDYFTSSLSLLQARMTGMALSAVVFIILVILALLLGVTAFVLLTIAFGMWLAKVTGHAGWALVILGSFYAVLAALLGSRAARNLEKNSK